MSFVVNPVRELQDFGQKVWLDELRRALLVDGGLTRLIEGDGICGVTSNPTILQKAFEEDEHYQGEIRRLQDAGAKPGQIYETLAVQDVRGAADQLHRVYRESGGLDGFVSLEVSPSLAFDTAGTIAEAERLHGMLDRPNVMIKVPATSEGLRAVRHLIGEGIHVNVTLLFGVARYRETVDAFMAGLEDRRKTGRPLKGIVSVASVFVSRLDTLVDRLLRSLPAGDRSERAAPLIGKAGVEVARFAYQVNKEILASARWGALAAHGATPQRLLWASTGTKDAAYSDVKYIDELIGRDCITTVPMATLAAYRDHGRPAPTLERNPYEMATFPSELQRAGIDLEEVSRQLEAEGLEKFAGSWKTLLNGLARAR